MVEDVRRLLSGTSPQEVSGEVEEANAASRANKFAADEGSANLLDPVPPLPRTCTHGTNWIVLCSRGRHQALRRGNRLQRRGTGAG